MNRKFDGIFNTHTFCVFKDFKGATGKLLDLNPRWIALNSLFWDGYIDTYIHTQNSDKQSAYDFSPDSDFNICSLPTLKDYLKSRGYDQIHVEPFEIDIDLPKPKDGRRQTYTAKTEWSERSQFSGPIYLPWHFVLALKN